MQGLVYLMVNLSKNACRLPVAKRWQDFRQRLAFSNVHSMYLCHKISCEKQKWNNLQFILNQIDSTETATLLSNFHERNLCLLPKILCLIRENRKALGFCFACPACENKHNKRNIN